MKPSFKKIVLRLPLYLGITVFAISLISTVVTVGQRSSATQVETQAGVISPTPSVVPTLPKK